MPAIRDYTYAYETLATDAGITIPMCNYQTGDLLLVCAMGDTGAGTWAASGYTQLLAQNNTCSAVVLWKYAGASEGDVVVTNTVNETYNGCVIAIRDVHPTNPFGSPSVSNSAAQAASARFAMQQITTNVANALVVAVCFSSGTAVPSFIEGAMTGLFGADGSAESMGVGWFMQRTAATTPNNLFCSNVSAVAGVKAMIQIAPPSGGATVIPAHCAGDASKLIDYIHGNAGFNGNTGLAATADTNFGTSIGGITANDATVAQSTDAGINSFHSFGRITNAATPGTISGAELVIAAANRFAMGSKNLLCHLRPQTPGQYQRLSPITSSRGVMMGVRSNTASGGATTGFKVWKVHGTGTNWPLDAKVPIVINNAAGNTVGTSGTLDAGVVTSVGFWSSAIGNLQAAIEFGPLWLLDTCTIAGGIAAEPVDIPGIVRAAAIGHERMSSVQQGSSQMLCLQNLQFGDGGTNGIYLDLDATAIEFPQQYSVAAGNVFYNGVDNTVGLTYYPGSGDTVKHRNSVVSSKSKFHWRIHASASAAAAYDFAGLAVIGAGDVVLRPVTTFTSMTFTRCPTIAQNGAALAECLFSNSHIAATDPAAISGSNFVSGGAGTGHAITITTAGTYTFAGNSFTSYGAGGSTDAAIYNNSGGAVVLNITGGGSTPTVRNGAGATTTVNNAKTLTITGFATGTDITILAAGTETILSNAEDVAGTSYDFTYETPQAVDITFNKPGFYPEAVRNFALAAVNSTLPVVQKPDASYLD